MYNFVPENRRKLHRISVANAFQDFPAGLAKNFVVGKIDPFEI
jgi:hypothetical protein